MTDYPIYEDPNVSKAAIMDYVFTSDFAALDAATKDHIRSCLSGDSVSFCCAHVAEWVFARMKTQDPPFPQSLVSLAAAAGAYALKYGVDNVSGDRGRGMVDALRRERGEPYPVTGGSWPEASADPEPIARFMPTVETPAPVAMEPPSPPPLVPATPPAK